MRKHLLFIFILFIAVTAQAQQGYVFSCTKDTTIKCSQSCITLKGYVPNIHAFGDDYEVNSLNTDICNIVIPDANQIGPVIGLFADDSFSQAITMAFDFPFYGEYYSQLVVSSNGVISFDISRALQYQNWRINGNLPTSNYDRAVIMGPFHDIDIRQLASSPSASITYHIEGVAPYRKWILDFHKIPLFDCNDLIENSSRIILNESTGIIDVIIFDQQICDDWNDGLAIVGLQNWDRDKAIMAPGRTATSPPWGSVGMNEAWRFTPKNGISLFQRVELFDLNGNLVSTGDTATLTPAVLSVKFPGVCPPNYGVNTYVVRSTYLSNIDLVTEVYGYDTVNIIKGEPPVLELDTTTAICGNNGAITIISPLGTDYEYSADGGASYQTSPVFSVPAGPYTVIVHDTAGGCYDTLNVNIDELLPPTASAAPTATSCPGVSNGSVAVHVSTGIPNFTFNLDGGGEQTDSVFRGVAAGPHSIVVKDAAGCSVTVPVDVPEGTGFTTTTQSITKPSCPGKANGSITVEVPSAGATPPFTYTISPATGSGGGSSPTFTGLAGETNYTITVEDGVGCTFPYPVELLSNPAFTTSTQSFVNASCPGAPNGSITVAQPSSGVSPFTYTISPAASGGGNSNTFTGLRGDSVYSIVIEDATGCQFPYSETIPSDNGFTTTTNATAKATCGAAANGSITVNVPLAGTAPYTYTISPAGSGGGASNTFTGLRGDSTYTIKVEDALGCSYTYDQLVEKDVFTTSTQTVVNASCEGVSNGSITVKEPLIGTAPFTYAIPALGISGTSPTLPNLAGGATYTIEVSDDLGCNYSYPQALNNDPGVSANATSVNSACSDVSTGKIVITPTAGTAPFYYNNNSAGIMPLDTIRNLASGTYNNIVVSDAVGCKFNLPPVTVNNSIGVTANAFKILPTDCATAATGVIIVVPATGERPFRYKLDNYYTAYQNDSVFRKLPTGAYAITIEDAIGCKLISSPKDVPVGPGVLTQEPVIGNASCASVPNGSITINTTNGIPPFNYQNLSATGNPPAQAGNQFANLFSGSYNILVTDSARCTKMVTAVVGNDPKVKFEPFTITNPTCKGLQDGTVVLNATLGVPPYQYAGDAGGFSSSPTITGIGAGSHVFHIKDANSCQIDTTINITEPEALTNSLVSTVKATCSGNPDGQITVSAAGGTPPYQYTLDAAGTSGYQASPTLQALKGNYTVTVKDANGCPAMVNARVDSVFSMFLDLGRDTTVCSGANIVLKPVTNAETSVFSYTPTTSLDKPNDKNPSASPTEPTTYQLTAQWGICTLTDKVKIDVLRKPVPEAGPEAVICFDTTTVLKASASNLSGTVNYSWAPASVIEGRADTIEITARPKELKTYYVVTVTDNYGCNFSVEDSVLVSMLPPIYAYAGGDTNAVLSMPHQLNATGAGVGGTYQWFNIPAGVTLSNPNISNPTAIFQPVPGIGTYHPDTNYYVLYFRATNQAGCAETGSVKINVFIGPTYYVPNAFSPNNDGFNDIFRPVPVGITSTEYFRVFNRYGQLVFETNRFMQGWDGTLKGEPQPAGNYVWVLKGVDRYGKAVETKGSVVLVR